MKTDFDRQLMANAVLSITLGLALLAGASAGCGGEEDGGAADGSAGDGWAGAPGGAGGAGGEGGEAATGGVQESGSGGAGGEAGSVPIAGGGSGGESGSAGTAGSGGAGGAIEDGTCRSKLPGIYGFKMDMDVYWTPLPDLLLASTTDPGRGPVRVYLQASIGSVNDDGSFEAEIHPCGIELPNLLSTLLCDYYRPEISESIWDSVASDTVAGRFTSFDPGGSIEIPLTSYLYGIELDDPDAIWPTAAQTATFPCPSGIGSDCFPDYDGDGKDGLTVAFGKIGERGGDTCGAGYWEYSTAPLSLDVAALVGGAARADQMYLGIRFRAAMGGQIGDDCESGSGLSEVGAFDIRMLGCRVQEGTTDAFGNVAGPDQPCDASQAGFLDGHLPVYIPLNEGETPPVTLNSMELFSLDLLNLLNIDTTASAGTSSSFVRLADAGATVTCDQVRDAAYP